MPQSAVSWLTRRSQQPNQGPTIPHAHCTHIQNIFTLRKFIKGVYACIEFRLITACSVSHRTVFLAVLLAFLPVRLAAPFTVLATCLTVLAACFWTPLGLLAIITVFDMFCTYA